MRTVVVDGNITFTGYDQVLGSELFKEILSEFIETLEKKNDPTLKGVEFFKSDSSYDLDSIIDVLSLLMIRHLDSMKGRIWDSLRENVDYFVNFVEELYNFWRSKHRFMVRTRDFPSSKTLRVSEEFSLMENGERFETILREAYRSVLRNTKSERLKVLRQLPSGVQAMFLASPHSKNLSVPVVWSVVLKPPVVFYTNSNKRKGVFPVRESDFAPDFSKEWLAFKVHVGKKIIAVIVEKDRLCHAAGISNLFELADPESEEDAYVVFGYPSEKLPEGDRNGVVYKTSRGYTGVVSDSPHTDYFGYMKKMILTVHNLMVIDEGNLPVHGALAIIRINDDSFSVMMVGDSGAGKSETLEALRKIGAYVDVIIDDMGSLEIEDGRVVAYGTEVGAFVRLDDLPPGYAYNTLDRSIFMNPDATNARVIVPFGNFEKVISPTPLDLFLYANNYESSQEKIRVFKSPSEALKVFSEGKRMAKGTTQEVGLTSSYFANPFGAVQRKEIHEKIAEKFVGRMFETGVIVGELRTMLGVPGYERKGPEEAARALVDFLSKLRK